MTFTKTPPTKPGAYWFRNKEGLANFLCDYDAEDIELLKTSTISTISGEWAGPLVPVEEVEKAYRAGWNKSATSRNGYCSDWYESNARKVVEGNL